MKTCWISIPPDQAGNYLATPGKRYAALVGVDARASLTDLEGALNKQGFDVTYTWQSGQAVRQQFFIDRWLASLPAPTAGTVWMYFEMNYNGDAMRTIVGHFQKCVLFICGNADIAYVFEAQEVADDFHPCGPGDPESTTPPLTPPAACPPQASPWGPALVGAAAGAALTAAILLVVD